MTPAVISAHAAAASPLGFLIGVSLGALGGGGSILAVPALVYGAGQDAKAASTSSLLVVGASALAGMLGHLRAGRVRLWSGLGFGLAGIGGSLGGTLLNRAVPSHVPLLAFAGLMLLAAWRMWSAQHQTPGPDRPGPAGRGPSAEPSTADPAAAKQQPPAAASEERAGDRHARNTPARIVLAGSAVGAVTGFFGVGGGFVIVPALVLALGLEMPTAIGTSLLVIAVSSAEALAFRLPSSTIDWSVATPFLAAALLGVAVGDLLAGRVASARLTRWFIWLLLAVAGYTAAQSLSAL